MLFNLWGLPKENILIDIQPPITANVTLMRLSKFVLDVVAHRKIPLLSDADNKPPSVLMKMDIEGKL